MRLIRYVLKYQYSKWKIGNATKLSVKYIYKNK